MGTFSHVTLTLARFDEAVCLTEPEPEPSAAGSSSSLRLLGSDDMVSHERIGTRTSHVWAVLGLHRSEDDADAAYRGDDGGMALVDGATETWSSLLQPYSHRGETNWSTDPLFAPGNRREHEGAFVVMTTVGFDAELDPDLTRVREFIRGVVGVRASFADTPGLRAQNVFWFGMTRRDPFTITVWDGDAELRPPVYEAGEHRSRMDDYHRNATADRTSFTRFRVLASAGTWNGSSPVDPAS